MTLTHGGIELAAAIGDNVQRKEAWEKVTGKAVYTDDLPVVGLLSARLLTSTCAHARIVGIDFAENGYSRSR
jgi:CO/xanthine dehydrogenase Mo-binding subunit